MAMLGIDYGAKKIGLAKADGSLAVPIGELRYKNLAEVLEKIKQVCQAENISQIVIGIPLSLSQKGGELEIRPQDLSNGQMQEVLDFVDWLKNNIKIPIVVEDERMSTKMAQRLQKDLTKKNGDDAVAAMLILQAYLDRQKNVSN